MSGVVTEPGSLSGKYLSLESLVWDRLSGGRMSGHRPLITLKTINYKWLFYPLERCVVIQMWMSVLWIAEVAVHTLTAPTHLEATAVPVLKDMLAMDLTVQVTLDHNSEIFRSDVRFLSKVWTVTGSATTAHGDVAENCYCQECQCWNRCVLSSRLIN